MSTTVAETGDFQFIHLLDTTFISLFKSLFRRVFAI